MKRLSLAKTIELVLIGVFTVILFYMLATGACALSGLSGNWPYPHH